MDYVLFFFGGDQVARGLKLWLLLQPLSHLSKSNNPQSRGNSPIKSMYNCLKKNMRNKFWCRQASDLTSLALSWSKLPCAVVRCYDTRKNKSINSIIPKETHSATPRTLRQALLEPAWSLSSWIDKAGTATHLPAVEKTGDKSLEKRSVWLSSETALPAWAKWEYEEVNDQKSSMQWQNQREDNVKKYYEELKWPTHEK